MRFTKQTSAKTQKKRCFYATQKPKKKKIETQLFQIYLRIAQIKNFIRTGYLAFCLAKM